MTGKAALDYYRRKPPASLPASETEDQRRTLYARNRLWDSFTLVCRVVHGNGILMGTPWELSHGTGRGGTAHIGMSHGTRAWDSCHVIAS